MSPPDGVRRRRSWGRGDLSPVSRPPIPPGRWQEGEALELLRDWAEARAVETIAWYLRDKRSKRWASRLLRAGAVVFAVAGGVLPLITSSLSGVDPNLGYVFLALAAGCVAFDHFFGLSAGWMRDIVAVQALQGTLARFHLDWFKWESEAAAIGAGFDLIGALIEDVAKITDAETGQWVSEFSSSVTALRQQANPGVAAPSDLITWGSHPIPPPG